MSFLTLKVPLQKILICRQNLFVHPTELNSAKPEGKKRIYKQQTVKQLKIQLNTGALF